MRRLTWGGALSGLGWAGWLAGLWAGGALGRGSTPNQTQHFSTETKPKGFWVWFGRRGSLGGLGRASGGLGKSSRLLKERSVLGVLGVLAGLGRVLLGGFGCVWGILGGLVFPEL